MPDLRARLAVPDYEEDRRPVHRVLAMRVVDMTIPGDATTGERQYRAAWFAISEQGEKSGTGDGQVLRSPDYADQESAAEDARIAGLLPYVTEAWVEVAEWRRLDSPEPSDAERVEAAHQRIHEAMGDYGCPWQGHPEEEPCRLRTLACAALDVPDLAFPGDEAGREA